MPERLGVAFRSYGRPRRFSYLTILPACSVPENLPENLNESMAPQASANAIASDATCRRASRSS
jgi:hypothetical protein